MTSTYIVLTDPFSGPTELKDVIDNTKGNKMVGLREITKITFMV